MLDTFRQQPFTLHLKGDIDDVTAGAAGGFGSGVRGRHRVLSCSAAESTRLIITSSMEMPDQGKVKGNKKVTFVTVQSEDPW